MLLRGRWLHSFVSRRLPGQSSVEIAAILAIMIPIIIGAADLGRAYFAYDILVHAVNEGARSGSAVALPANVPATATDVVLAAGDILNLAVSDVNVTCYAGATTTVKTCSAMTIGDSVRVTANRVFTPITPLLTSLLPGGILTLVATSQRTFQ